MQTGDREADEKKSVGGRMYDVPWCSIMLVSCAIAAHSLVLMGNLATAKTFNNIGASTNGWSDVGLSLSNSVVTDIEVLMGKTNQQLTKALNEAVSVEKKMNLVLGSSGNTTQAAIETLSTDHAQAALIGSVGRPKGTGLPNDMPAYRAKVHAQVEKLVADLKKNVLKFWGLIKPGLVQIGKWLSSMGTKMQGFIEQFSTTIDKAQKIFDQIMTKLSGSDNIKEELVNNTFAIFDIRQTGQITAKDVSEVASLYGATAIAGPKGKELFTKYDTNNDGFLSKAEYSLFVDDPSLPSLMTYVLRTFSKKLSQVAGQLKGAKMRDEIADTVVQYFQLMVAKNRTKVGWVSQALTNGSLPLEFSADIFRQLVMQDRAPDKLASVPVGQTIITNMVELNAAHVVQVIKKLSDATFWNAQGFDPKIQPVVVKRVIEWANVARKTSKGTSLLEGTTDELAHLTAETLAKGMQRHRHKVRQERIREHEKVFHSAATRHLYRHLLGQSGGDSMVGASEDKDVNRVLQGGVPAAAETLQFARWLVNNASDTSQRFQNYSFNYAKTSSNPIDNFANQIQAFVKKVQQFLDLMMSYSSKRGISDLEKQIFSFTENAEKDISKVVNDLIDQKINQISAAQGEGNLEEDGKLSTLELHSRTELGLSSAWKDIRDMMTGLKGILPTVIDDIKFARKEVSAVSSTLHSIFSVMKDKASPIFEMVSRLYKTVWIVYYCLFMVLTLFVLFYAFWSSGYLGGPTPGIPGDLHADESFWQKPTFRQKCSTCCSSCLVCMRGIQDGHLCFWSCILLSEAVILIMFAISILLTVLAGLKAFISTGCAQIYVLGDDDVCNSIVLGLGSWLSSFWSDQQSSLKTACAERTLPTCKAVSDEMMKSIMFTVVGSFAAALFSIQLLFLSAQLHERAVWNNKLKAAIESES